MMATVGKRSQPMSCEMMTNDVSEHESKDVFRVLFIFNRKIMYATTLGRPLGRGGEGVSISFSFQCTHIPPFFPPPPLYLRRMNPMLC